MSDCESASSLVNLAEDDEDDNMQGLLEPLRIPAPVNDLSVHQLRDVSYLIYLVSFC